MKDSYQSSHMQDDDTTDINSVLDARFTLCSLLLQSSNNEISVP